MADCQIFCGKIDCNICLPKSFANHPKSLFWSKNNSIKPYQILQYSNILFEFICDKCNHYFNSVPCDISSKNRWCPYCSSRKLCKENCKVCFEKSFASHEKSKYWDYTLNKEIIPRNVFKSARNKYFFNCVKCNHKFDTSLNKISYHNRWCPYCPSRKLCKDENCKICFEKSFASHSMSKFWGQNKTIPRFILKQSNAKYNFICDICSHSFDMQISCMEDGKKSCPFCSSQIICKEKNHEVCFKKTFASHPYSKYWNYKLNSISPTDIFIGCNKKYFFTCEKCEHHFESVVNSVSSSKKFPCGYCTNKILCNNKKCDSCFRKSFANHEKSKYWDYKKNNLTPRDIFRCAKNKYFFICERCKSSFSCSLNSIVSGGCWCPYCHNKTEIKLWTWLIKLFPDTIRQYKPDWSFSYTTNRKLPFDLYIPTHNIIIEIDGPQHFFNVSNWGSPKYTQTQDLHKMKLAYNKSVSDNKPMLFIRIPYEYIYKEKFFPFAKLKISYYINEFIKNSHDFLIILLDDEDDIDRYSYIKNFNFEEYI